MSESQNTGDTFAPARNFTITLADRMAAAGGPLAYMRRKRAIEDLEAATLRAIRALADDLTRTPLADFRAALMRVALKKLDLSDSKGRNVDVRRLHDNIRELNQLIEKHNKYYPVEANLPIHPITGALVEHGGRPWQPLSPVTLEDLVARVAAERMSAAAP